MVARVNYAKNVLQRQAIFQLLVLDLDCKSFSGLLINASSPLIPGVSKKYTKLVGKANEL